MKPIDYFARHAVFRFEDFVAAHAAPRIILKRSQIFENQGLTQYRITYRMRGGAAVWEGPISISMGGPDSLDTITGFLFHCSPGSADASHWLLFSISLLVQGTHQ